MKVSLCFSSLALAILCLSTQAYTQVTPESHEFAWDLHDVIFEKSKTGMANQGLKHTSALVKNSVGLAGEAISSLFTGKKGKRMQMLSQIKQLKKSGATGEAYQELMQSVDPELGKMIEEMANEQYPIEGMPELIQELHELGYRHRVASNIGIKFFSNLKNKYSNIFSYFTGGKMVDYTKQPYIKKPDIQYFQDYIAQFPERKKIFIDDKKENVLSALETGMIGIQFKNVDQLREELNKLGIPVKTSSKK